MNKIKTTAGERAEEVKNNFLGAITTPEEDQAAVEKIIQARVGLLLNSPFFGQLAVRLRLEKANDWLSTAATNGRYFFYNSKFINSLSPKECEFLFAHEILHICYEHTHRGEDKDHMLFNIACDYVVNSDIIDQRIGERIKCVPPLYDAKYRGKTAEEVYDDLYENAVKIDIQDLYKQLLDEHTQEEDDENGQEENNDGRIKLKLSREERALLRDEIREAMLSALQSSGCGNLPGNLKRIIDSFTSPKISWKELLQQQIESAVKSDFTWMRPSKKSWHIDAILPGLKPKEKIDIVVAIDTSGSITQKQLTEFLSEINGIMSTYDDFSIYTFCFDTKVYNPQTYTPDNAYDIVNYQLEGSGGTDFESIWLHLQENNITPKKLVIFTDMYAHFPTKYANYCDVIWIAHGSDTVAPFGVTAKFDSPHTQRN